jgi:hypothetical protein
VSSEKDASGSKSDPVRSPSLVDQAKGKLEDWQHQIDERVRTVVPSLLPWQQLELEVKRLTERVEALESQAAAQVAAKDGK